MSRTSERIARLRQRLKDLEDDHIRVIIAGTDKHPPIVIDFRTAKYVDGHLVIPRQDRSVAPSRAIVTRGKRRIGSRSSSRRRGA